MELGVVVLLPGAIEERVFRSDPGGPAALPPFEVDRAAASLVGIGRVDVS